jgi:hypothetical protein
MRKLKEIIKYWLPEGIWTINIYQSKPFFWIEITDPPYFVVQIEELLTKVFHLAFRQQPYLYVSQFVDREQWQFVDLDEFLKEKTQNYTLPFFTSQTYASSALFHPAMREFVVHVLGTSDYNWLRTILRFSMTNLPHIIYGYKSYSNNWQLELLERNRIFVEWFNLKIGDDHLLEILHQADIVGCTIDGHVCIATINGEFVDNFLEGLKLIAKEKSLRFKLQIVS